MKDKNLPSAVSGKMLPDAAPAEGLHKMSAELALGRRVRRILSSFIP
jgi:hypothetical protein